MGRRPATAGELQAEGRRQKAETLTAEAQSAQRKAEALSTDEY